MWGSRERRGIIYGRPCGDRDRNGRRTKLVRWCEATAIGRGICGDFGYKCTNLPSNVPRSPFRQKGYECYLIVYNCLIDVAPTQVAWNRWRATGTSTSVTSCTSLPHQFARRAAGGGGGRSRSAYRDERERNDPHTSEDKQKRMATEQRRGHRYLDRSASTYSIDYRDRRSINYLAHSQLGSLAPWVYRSCESILSAATIRSPLARNSGLLHRTRPKLHRSPLRPRAGSR